MKALNSRRGRVVFVSLLLVMIGLGSACTDDTSNETVGGYEVGQIVYGEDQCPTASVAEVTSAFPEMGTVKSPTLITTGPEYVCNFGGDGEGLLRLVGGDTGNASLPTWGKWTTTEPVPQPVYIYEVDSTEVWVLETASGGLESAFKGLDNAVWRVDAQLDGDPDREIDIELTMVRAMLTN